MAPVTALFVCKSSPYWDLVDCYDYERNALTFAGSGRVICHPPCRAWGRYKAVAKATPEEKQLALFALELVRANGGVLEHPVSSGLWKHLRPGETSLVIRQADFGHRAEKLTRLFYAKMPRVPLLPEPAVPPFVPVENMGRAERERTPPNLAKWLVDWAQSTAPLDENQGRGITYPLVPVCN